MELKNKVVVITGGSIGIGKETAYKFSEEKCRVIITYYQHKKEALNVVKKCYELGASDVYVTHLDIKKESDIKRVVKEIAKKFGRIDILINNSGIVVWKNFESQNFKEIDEQIETNLKGLIKFTKESLPYIKETIINIASTAGIKGYEELTTYCATKFGVRGFTQALAIELKKIKVYNVNPGTTSTRMTGFTGVHPSKVAGLIVNICKDKYKLKTGSDFNVRDYV
ncbi:SDR family oxidoreductase [Candidatus Pacearchaeota archaeon]|nr:SDR family oxidoreductase [Candidatus Pacearchaeota archaeon]